MNKASRLCPMPPRRLSDLAADLGRLHGDAVIQGICDDTRKLVAGEAWLCLPRVGQDKDAFATMAEARDAAAIIYVGHGKPKTSLPLVELSSMDQAGILLRRWFESGNTRTQIIGVTGTDGKTSVTWMARKALQRLAGKAWSCGTLGWIHDDQLTDMGNTTPSLLHNHAILGAATRERIPYLVIEVSSHGIAQERIAGLDFAAAVWTSIGRDHLQDHGGYESYLKLKADFVRHVAKAGNVVIANADHADIRAHAPEPTHWYGHGLYREELDLAWEQELPGMVRLNLGGHEVVVEDIPIGEFHAENLAGTALLLNQLCRTPIEKMPEALNGIDAPPGRMQDLGCGQWQVFVDYAHTPDALARCLKSARALTEGRLLLVFGCGGERDRSKRPQMGSIADELADVVWITSDNPRGEPPEIIASEIAQGLPSPAHAEIHLQLDRERAIAEAIHSLVHGDTLVIAGKGAESYMELAGVCLPWSDAEVARKYLAEKAADEGMAACA